MVELREKLVEQILKILEALPSNLEYLRELGSLLHTVLPYAAEEEAKKNQVT